MNTLKKISLAAALAAGLLASGVASAANICQGCAYRFDGDGGTGLPVAGVVGSFLGTYDPTSGALPTDVGDSGSYTHGGLGAGGFSDSWIFTVNPAGRGEWDATFNPGADVSSFSASIFTTSGQVCTATSDPQGAALARQAGFCTSNGVVGVTSLGTLSTSFGGLRISNLTLPAGSYVIQVAGTVSGTGTGRFYSGNITTRIPEPGSLALVAVGLLAAAAGLRRRA